MASIKTTKYFCVCSDCGSLGWMDGEGYSNALNDDGELIIDNDDDINKQIFINDYGEKTIIGGKEMFCHTCEKKLIPIPFSEINRKKRIKIYKMDDEERINWIKSRDIVDKLEDKTTIYIIDF